MFRGTFEHSIDEKGRTSLPSKFRELLSAASDEALVVTHGPDRALWCMPPSTWAEVERKFGELPQFDPEVLMLGRGFIAPAQDVSFDRLGRLVIPPLLRTHAGLNGDIVWVGQTKRFELWSAEQWNKAKPDHVDVFKLAAKYNIV